MAPAEAQALQSCALHLCLAQALQTGTDPQRRPGAGPSTGPAPRRGAPPNGLRVSPKPLRVHTHTHRRSKRRGAHEGAISRRRSPRPFAPPPPAPPLSPLSRASVLQGGRQATTAAEAFAPAKTAAIRLACTSRNGPPSPKTHTAFRSSPTPRPRPPGSHTPAPTPLPPTPRPAQAHTVCSSHSAARFRLTDSIQWQDGVRDGLCEGQAPLPTPSTQTRLPHTVPHKPETLNRPLGPQPRSLNPMP